MQLTPVADKSVGGSCVSGGHSNTSRMLPALRKEEGRVQGVRLPCLLAHAACPQLMALLKQLFLSFRQSLRFRSK